MGLVIEVANRSGVAVDEAPVRALCEQVLSEEGILDGDLGISFVDAREMRTLKREHLGLDEAADVLSFPIDEREPLEAGVPRQLGDVFLCPAVVGDAWERPLVHGLLHLLGYDHGSEMERREAAHGVSAGLGRPVAPAAGSPGEGRA